MTREKLNKILLELEKAIDEFTSQEVVLSADERWHLIDDLDYLKKATKHEYKSIEYADGPIFPQVRFYYKSKTHNQKRYDTIGGSPCYTQKLEPYKEYEIRDLI